jgi:hypothetical protein
MLQNYIKTDIDMSKTINNWIVKRIENGKLAYIVEFTDWLREVLYMSREFKKSWKRINTKLI